VGYKTATAILHDRRPVNRTAVALPQNLQVLQSKEPLC